MKAYALLVLALLAAPAIIGTAHAQAAAAPWSWSNYSGTTNWNVVFTEDDNDCEGGGIYTSSGRITITHRQSTASFRDEHGQVTGTFISPNILHVNGRPTRDSDGSSSVISAYDLFFTTDCKSFAASYSWDYEDPYGGSCSGTTRMAGTNMEGSCPEAGPVTPPVNPPSGTTQPSAIDQRVAAAHSDLRDYLIDKYELGGDIVERQLLHAKVEGEYEGILHDKPDHPQANADMAVLKKSDGKEDEYQQYMDRALQSGYDKTKTVQGMQDSTKKELGLNTAPNPYHSSFVRIMSGEKDDPQVDKTTWMMKLYSQLAPPPSIIDTLIFK